MTGVGFFCIDSLRGPDSGTVVLQITLAGPKHVGRYMVESLIVGETSHVRVQ